MLWATCLQNIIGISVKMMAQGSEHIGISVKMMAQGSEQRSQHTFWILLWQRQLQTYQTHIGPTFHVGPNNLK